LAKGQIVIEEAFGAPEEARLETLVARLKAAGKHDWLALLGVRLAFLAENGLDRSRYFVNPLGNDTFELDAHRVRLLFHLTPPDSPCTGIRITNGHIGRRASSRKHVERAVRIRREDQQR
jgi:hypothetical protein